MDQPLPKPEVQELHLPTAKVYLTEDDICALLHCTKRAFQLRPESAKPPAIYLSKRNKLWDPVEVNAWMESRPRTKPAK